LLTFSGKHTISNGAKKLRVFLGKSKSMEEVEIISIPSPEQVIINAKEIKNDNIFVYGEQVDDFRSVDYDGLTTLNISATQEISRQLKKQAEIITTQQKQITLLEKRLTALEEHQAPKKIYHAN